MRRVSECSVWLRNQEMAGQNKKLADTQLPASESQTMKPKTRVIVLGRGNSFNLGGSEVILLNQKRGRANTRFAGVHEGSADCLCVGSNDKSESEDVPSLVKEDTVESSLMVPVCDGRATESAEADVVVDEVDTAWRKAEMIMAAKNETVLKVLEQFGIGRTWGLTEAGADKLAEEECIWHTVEVSANRTVSKRTVTERGMGHVRHSNINQNNLK
ncbi:unnamed protein product [Candidula unifasciata]|uniref:Uncharacterized protein n=1 Tax=Candidula unifasciata TaxID=100452 RepID=A0A8S3Z0R7_9EUPU|nr:unnamed protein product [Candidula unifasciata]